MFLLLCPFTIFGDGSLLALLHYLSFEISDHFSVDLLFDSVSSRDIWVFVGLESAGSMGFKGKNIGCFKKETRLLYHQLLGLEGGFPFYLKGGLGYQESGALVVRKMQVPPVAWDRNR